MLSKEHIKRLLTMFIVIVITATISFPVAAATTNTSVSTTFEPVTTSAALVIDSTTGEVLYSYNADVPLPPASTTKMLTTLLVLEAVERGDIALDDMVLVTEEEISTIPYDASRMSIPLESGEYMSLHDLLYANMLSSDCMASNILGAHVTGNVESFVELMNTRAAELGCENTFFTNPSGYPDELMHTTAHSLYLIAAECMKHELFCEIVSAKEYTISPTNLNDKRELYNTNRLLHPSEGTGEDAYINPYYYEYAIGIKTGFSSSSGYCLVSAALKDSHQFYVVILGGELIEYEDGSYTYTQYTETLRSYNHFYDFIFKREYLQNEFETRTQILKGTSSAASITRSQVLEEDISIVTAFEEKMEAELYNRKVMIISSSISLLILAVITIIVVSVHQRKKKILKTAVK